jgi:DNA polymerase V
VYIRTSPFKEKQAFYSNGLTIPLSTPSDDTRTLVKVALWGLKKIYQPHYDYAKAGVMLDGLVPGTGVQTDLFSTDTPEADPDVSQLMVTLDAINRKMGKASVKLASEGFSRPWRMKQNHKSPCYTTHWQELIKAS